MYSSFHERLTEAIDKHLELIRLFLLVAAPFAVGVLATQLGEDSNWDLRNYHWYNAYAFWTDRSQIDLLPSQIQYFINPLIDIPFYLLARSLPAEFVGFILGTVQGLNFVLLYLLAEATLPITSGIRRLLACAGVAALGILGAEGIAEIGTTFYDNVTSLGVLLSTLLIVRNWAALSHAPAMQRALRTGIFGIPCGLMMGLKFPSALFCLALCFALLTATRDLKRNVAHAAAFGCGVLIGATITYGYWGYFLEVHYGSPFFPWFNAVFKAPLTAAENVRDGHFLPQSLWEYFFYPYVFAKDPRRVGEIAWRDWRLPLLYAFLPLTALVVLFTKQLRTLSVSFGYQLPAEARAASSPVFFLIVFFVIAYVLWLVLFSLFRYALPLEMLAPLLISLLTLYWPVRNKFRAGIAVLILLTCAGSVEPGVWSRRSTWTHHFVEGKIPDLGDTSDLMILMGGFWPYSYLLSLFPPEIPFVRIQSSFSGAFHGDWFDVDFDEERGMNKLIKERVAAHKGRLLYYTPMGQKDVVEDVLRRFDLAFGPEPCQMMPDILVGYPYMGLCPLIRLSSCSTDYEPSAK